MRRTKGILVATMIAGRALSGSAFAAGGQGKGQATQKQTRSTNQIQKQQRVQDGSRTQSGTLGTKNKSGNAYGPGDSTGNQGVGAKDGTCYGAPGNR